MITIGKDDLSSLVNQSEPRINTLMKLYTSWQQAMPFTVDKNLRPAASCKKPISL